MINLILGIVVVLSIIISYIVGRVHEVGSNCCGCVKEYPTCTTCVNCLGKKCMTGNEFNMHVEQAYQKGKYEERLDREWYKENMLSKHPIAEPKERTVAELEKELGYELKITK